MNTEVANPIEFTKPQQALLSRTIAAGATPDELALFIGQCKRTRLDPFSRHIHFIKDKKDGRMMIQIGVDGFRVIAQRSGDYAGQDAPVFEEDANGKIKKCSVTVYRWRGDLRYQASVGVAYWNEYNRPGYGEKKSNWDKMPHTMIAKVAECVALRKAFPNDLSGLYAPEEADSAAMDVVDVPDEDAKTAKKAEAQKLMAKVPEKTVIDVEADVADVTDEEIDAILTKEESPAAKLMRQGMEQDEPRADLK